MTRLARGMKWGCTRGRFSSPPAAVGMAAFLALRPQESSPCRAMPPSPRADPLRKSRRCAACRRSFNRDAMFNIHQRGQDYSEYAGKTLDEVYPILGCCTITASSGAWEAMAETYAALPAKFKRWYGDQEVLRDYVNSLPASWVTYLPEFEFACLPEAANVYPRPSITHYKGQRKALLNGVAPA